MSDDLLFQEEEEHKEEASATPRDTWKILVIDDEHEVHRATRLALADFLFEDRGLELISGYSGADARRLIKEHPDTAMMLLDVVMESDHAGLEVAKYIREEAGNRLVRIILRTGQPGQAPEQDVIANYDINDYKEKAELTSEKLITVVTASLRAYQDLNTMEQLVKAAKAANLIDLKLLDNISRELRKPMQNILGSTYQGLEGIDVYAKEKLRRCYANILLNGLQLFDVINNIRDFAKLETSGLECNRQGENNLLDVVKTVAREWDVLLKERSLKLEITAFDCETRAWFDVERIFQVIRNLFSNAIKFSPKGKAIIVSLVAANLTVNEEKDAIPATSFSIRDEGIGIPEDELTIIFNKFVHSSRTKTGVNGIGLGLTIVREIIALHGGTILAENNPGEGATFTFTIPIKQGI